MEDQMTLSTVDREKKLVERFKAAREEFQLLQTEAEEAKKELIQVESELMELLDDQGKKSSAKFEGLGHVTCVEPQVYASFIEGMAPLALVKIEELGRADMIKRTVHPGTLSTFVKELLAKNVPLPDGITYYEKRYLKFYPIKSN